MSSLSRIWRWVAEHYAELDPRTLGLYRIAIGALLCADCLRHWSFATRYYSNAGLLTNHWHLFRPSSEYNFSLFHSFSSPEEVHVAFALSLVCYLLFAVGYKTRLFNALSFLWVTSMDSRLVLVENGGYVVVNLAVMWAMFLPTGTRFSVDSLIRSLREHRESSVRELNERHRPQRLYAPVRSMAAFVLLLNFLVIYVFNVVNKYGATWRSGRTIQYVLHIDRMVTGLAVWCREHLPFIALRMTTWVILICEALIVTTILWPKNRLWSRPTALVLIFGLHLVLGVMMRLGPFSWFMIGWSTMLLGAVHWEWLTASWQRKVGVVRVRCDATSGVRWQLCRLLARIDLGDRVRFDDGSGLSAPESIRTPESEPAPIVIAARKWGARLATLVVLYLLVCAVSQVINENKSIPKQLKHKLPAPMRATVIYPRLFQGWGMFAPNPIRDDGSVSVDALTIDGRHVDPFTGREPDLNLSDAQGLGLDQIEQDYFNRIRLNRNKGIRKELERWILRYHRDTGRPEDEIVFFNVWWLRDQSPELGSREPFEHEMLCIYSYKKPRFRPTAGVPALPQTCKVVSAEKEDRGHTQTKGKSSFWSWIWGEEGYEPWDDTRGSEVTDEGSSATGEPGE